MANKKETKPELLTEVPKSGDAPEMLNEVPDAKSDKDLEVIVEEVPKKKKKKAPSKPKHSEEALKALKQNYSKRTLKARGLI